MKTSSTRIAVFVCVIALISACTAVFVKARVGVDDAYISYRYALNLFEGHGLVYNVGERVEGYTNLLYVLLMSLGLFFFKASDLHTFSFLVNTACVVPALLLYTARLREEYGEAAALAGAVVFCANMSLMYWTSSGMETIVVFLFQLILWIYVEKVRNAPSQRSPLIVLCGATMVCVLLRADGFAAPALAVAYLILNGKWKPASILAGVLVASTAGLTAWRYEYYGYPFPNTYYAKVDGPLFERSLMAMKLLLKFSFTTGLILHIAALIMEALARVKNST